MEMLIVNRIVAIQIDRHAYIYEFTCMVATYGEQSFSDTANERVEGWEAASAEQRICQVVIYMDTPSSITLYYETPFIFKTLQTDNKPNC